MTVLFHSYSVWFRATITNHNFRGWTLQMEKIVWATVSLSCVLRKCAWTDSISTSAAVTPLHQQVTANCRSEERCCASPPVCSELGGTPSFPFPYGVWTGEGFLDIWALPFCRREREGCWKQMWCFLEGGGPRLPGTCTPEINTVWNMGDSRGEDRVCSLQPTPSPCTSRHLEKRSKGSPQRHTLCL